MRARNRWGWGFEDAAFSTADARAAAPGLIALLGFGETEPEEPVAPEAFELATPRLECPPHLRGICTDDDATRIAHAHGQSYLDTVRGLRGRHPHAPDLVARPRDERELEDMLQSASRANAGGGEPGARGGGAVWRRHERRRRRRAARAVPLRRRRHDRPRPDRRG